MENRIIKKGAGVQEKIIAGVNETVDAIKVSLGPNGKHVAVVDSLGVQVTRDGATIAKTIRFSDPEKNIGADLVKKAATMSEDQAGDGPQPLYAKVLTPNGWTTMGELKIGDEICGTNGTIQKVIGTFAKGQKEIYKVHFANGQVVECCEDHLWNVTTKGGKYKTLPLKEIIKTGVIYNKPCGEIQYNFFTPKTKVDFPKKNLPIDPYLLGLLLGDGSLGSNGSIELSLGFRKEHVIDDIVLPENIKYNIKKDSTKNYIRVKISRISDNGPTMHDYIRDLGLLDTKSGTKFIPKDYLYTSEEDRLKLFSGLMNTDGYLNSKGLYEYSTTSEQLCKDIVELMNGLGMFTNVTYHTREKDIDSYSDTPIYRISQLVGYKFGTKLVGVEKTGEYTEMMCIKVSNPDELYITNDYIVTHNTSTTSLLIGEFCKRGQKAVQTGSNVNELKSGMSKAGKWMKEYIKNNAIEIDGDLEKIRKVATISANNDPEVGDLVVKGLQAVGLNGLVTTDMASGLDTVIDITTGMKLDRGWNSPQYVTSPEDGKCILENPYVFVVGEKISSVAQIYNFLESYQREGNGQSLLIVCDDIDENVNGMFVVNTLRGAIRCCVVKGIDFGDNRKNVMADVAAVVGADYICPDNGSDLSKATVANLGMANKVVVSRDNCIIYEGHGDPDEINKRADIIKARLADEGISDYDKTKFEKRLANLTGGIAVIRAGGASEVEKANRKATIEDSVLAAKSAIEEGCVPGGGYIFFNGSVAGLKDKDFWKTLTDDEKEGAKIVFSSLPVVLKTIAENAGVSGDVVLEEQKKLKKENMGFNAKTKKFVDLFEAGVLDSAKVLRVSLENSISAASMILLIDCTISDEPEKKKDCCCGGDPMAGMM